MAQDIDDLRRSQTVVLDSGTGVGAVLELAPVRPQVATEGLNRHPHHLAPLADGQVRLCGRPGATIQLPLHGGAPGAAGAQHRRGPRLAQCSGMLAGPCRCPVTRPDARRAESLGCNTVRYAPPLTRAALHPRRGTKSLWVRPAGGCAVTPLCPILSATASCRTGTICAWCGTTP